MIGHQTHLKENEDLPLLDSPLIEARRAKKNFLETAPPPSEGLDPPLTSRYVFVVVVVVVLLVCLFIVFLRTYPA